jgi:hypothetical protein
VAVYNASDPAKTGQQQWAAPFDGDFRFVAFGAQGGTQDPVYLGGKGGLTEGVFTLAAGETLDILVGQSGASGGRANGGGGTFVVGAHGKLLVAGGGGGVGSGDPRWFADCPSSASGGSCDGGVACRGGSNGYGGTSDPGGSSDAVYGGGSGGGFVGAGTGYAFDGVDYGGGGAAYLQGGAGGTTSPCGNATASAYGGFGGGGSASGARLPRLGVLDPGLVGLGPRHTTPSDTLSLGLHCGAPLTQSNPADSLHTRNRLRRQRRRRRLLRRRRRPPLQRRRRLQVRMGVCLQDVAWRELWRRVCRHHCRCELRDAVGPATPAHRGGGGSDHTSFTLWSGPDPHISQSRPSHRTLPPIHPTPPRPGPHHCTLHTPQDP